MSAEREPWDFSQEVLDKALGYVQGRRVQRTPLGTWRVMGSARSPYTVRTDASAEDGTVTWATCTCPHGLEQGAGAPWCSHVAAVLLVVRQIHRDKSGRTG